MKLIYEMELVLIAIICILCTIVIFKLLYKLRSLPWRVNCWFCNNNFIVKFPERNSWTCPKCEQYNGFSKDGDYNKPLFSTNEQVWGCPKVFHRSPPRNGLCKMCNINQQLKVTQLANFVPMNERNYEQEIESYQMQLEKAYKLCNPCKQTVQLKLHKEKEILLGHKLLETRTLEQSQHKQKTNNQKLKKILNKVSMIIAGFQLIILTLECYRNVMTNKNVFSAMINLKDIIIGLIERITSIVVIKTLMAFPFLEHYISDIKVLYLEYMPKDFDIDYEYLHKVAPSTQKVLGGLACLIQVIGHMWNVNGLKSSIAIDLLWTVFLTAAMSQKYVDYDPAIISFVKLTCVLAVIIVYKSLKTKTIRPAARSPTEQKRMNLSKMTINSTIDDDLSMDTDDDVSLCKFGLHNFTDSSNETINPLNNTVISGRSFTPRKNNLWMKPKLNSTFCVNSLHCNSPSVNSLHYNSPSVNFLHCNSPSVNSPHCKSPSVNSPHCKSPSVNSPHCKSPSVNSLRCKSPSVNSLHCKSPSSVSDTVFVKPVFNKYQYLDKDESDSDLDESISSLCISTPRKSNKSSGSVFSLRKFKASPNFLAPMPISRSRPLISPSKLGHGTSWVAGGYWGVESERSPFSVGGSRSSSQSSGFESQASSANRNVFSQPPSREESLCGEPDRASGLLDRFQSCSTATLQTPQNFSRMSSPVFPQMQYNGHVHIPQARFTLQPASAHASQGVFTNHYAQTSIFKAPGGSGLIKLPQVNSFASR